MAIANSEMKPSRFLRLYNARKLWKRINAAWDAGQMIQVTTYTRATRIKPHARDALRLNGHRIEMRRGKSWDICFDGLTGCKFSAFAA